MNDHLTTAIEDMQRAQGAYMRGRGPREVPVEVVCDAMAARCTCDLDGSDGHETHSCECGGQWTGTNPEFHVVRFPQVFVG